MHAEGDHINLRFVSFPTTNISAHWTVILLKRIHSFNPAQKPASLCPPKKNLDVAQSVLVHVALPVTDITEAGYLHGEV